MRQSVGYIVYDINTRSIVYRPEDMMIPTFRTFSAAQKYCFKQNKKLGIKLDFIAVYLPLDDEDDPGWGPMRTRPYQKLRKTL